MPLYKNGGFTDDAWRHLPHELPALAATGPTIVPAPRLTEVVETAKDVAQLGVALEPDDDLDAIVPHLPHLDLIALPFPKFGDGRSYSTAHILRTHHGFTGELRATGEVLFDQITHMLACGFDAFEVTHAPTLEHLRTHGLPKPSGAYRRKLSAVPRT
jgi:uncharacterized protein (DUF934 family)